MGEKLTHLTAAQMREADRRCIEGLGIPGAVLMNNAGAAVFRELHQGPVGIVCGKGNNGGDGFVVARLALLAGMDPTVVLLSSPESLSGDAALYVRAYQRLGGHLKVATSEDDARLAVSSLAGCAVLVDAMLGTGVQGELRGVFRAAIEVWPAVRTIAVDLPSGLDADTGECLGCCVRADTTVTFQYPKRGFLNPAARPYIGNVIVADIGIPAVCADEAAWRTLRLLPE